MSSLTGLSSTLNAYRWSDNVVKDVAAKNQISDPKALLEKAVEFDADGNKYLKRTELDAAAKELRSDIPSGYRWSASVLMDVMAAYGIDASKVSDLIKTAVQLDDGNKYLKRSELTAAAEKMAATVPQGYRWSPTVLANVMTQSGIADQGALLREAAARFDSDGNKYLKRSELEAAAKVLTGSAPEIGIISDLDRTIIPAHTGDLPDAAYPGVAQLFLELELKDGGSYGDTYYVTARSPDRIVDVPDWLAAHDMPAGPIDTGVGTLPWVAQPEKVADVKKVLDANPEQKFILFGDTNHRDPDVYREIIAAYPDQITAAFVHKVKNISDTRRQGLVVFNEYTEVAAKLLQLGVLDEAAARRVMVAAQVEGVDITDAQIDELIASHQPG